MSQPASPLERAAIAGVVGWTRVRRDSSRVVKVDYHSDAAAADPDPDPHSVERRVHQVLVVLAPTRGFVLVEDLDGHHACHHGGWGADVLGPLIARVARPG